MNFSSLFNKIDSTRRIKSNIDDGSSSGGGSSGKKSFADETAQDNSNSTDDFDRSKYLLSDKHLKITILYGGDQDDSKLEFEWFAVDITETEITIQVLFKTPLYISTDPRFPDTLLIKLLPGFL